MNWTRLLLAVIGGFAVIFVYDFVFHGIYMKNAWYDTNAHFWRPEAETPMHLMAIAQFFMASAIGGLVAIGHRPGLLHGATVGALVGLFATAGNLVGYAVQPFPAGMVSSWILGSMIQCVLVGLVIAAIYQPKGE